MNTKDVATLKDSMKVFEEHLHNDHLEICIQIIGGFVENGKSTPGLKEEIQFQLASEKKLEKLKEDYTDSTVESLERATELGSLLKRLEHLERLLQEKLHNKLIEKCETLLDSCKPFCEQIAQENKELRFIKRRLIEKVSTFQNKMQEGIQYNNTQITELSKGEDHAMRKCLIERVTELEAFRNKFEAVKRTLQENLKNQYEGLATICKTFLEDASPENRKLDAQNLQAVVNEGLNYKAEEIEKLSKKGESQISSQRQVTQLRLILETLQALETSLKEQQDTQRSSWVRIP